MRVQDKQVAFLDFDEIASQSAARCDTPCLEDEDRSPRGEGNRRWDRKPIVNRKGQSRKANQLVLRRR